ncbi:MAG: sugar ABC transporter permease YjfF [Candidatus Sumerlaeota bacterium]|nr:sugar ABC transporter permease YjfF [Candidatus Sumerlaeota bacterium]
MTFPLGKKYVPLVATGVTLLLLYATASLKYDGFFSLNVAANLLLNNAHLAIAAIGMTFVIVSGGIDLSVGAVVGFTTIFVAVMIQKWGISPYLAWAIMLTLGAAFGAGMGLLIHGFRLPAFLVTLGGMFFARGMGFVVETQSVGIDHPVYKWITDHSIPLTGRVSLGLSVLIFFAVLMAGLYLAHYARFGRNVYALGGSSSSSILMGLPVASTTVRIYALNGFCSALAGIVYTYFTLSGNPTNGVGMELDVIAAVVIGGTLLTGGVGFVFGTVLGVLIFGVIQEALTFDGRLNSFWLKIIIGLLLLIFILMQKIITSAAARGAATRT